MAGLQRLGALIIFLFMAPCWAQAVEVTTAPGDYLFAIKAKEDRGYFDLMVQTIIIHNDSPAPVTLTSMQIDVIGAPGEIMSKTVPIANVVGQTQQFAGMAAQGFGVFINAQMLNADGLAGIFGGGSTLASSAALAHDDVALSTGHYFAVDFSPKSILITVNFADAEGGVKSTRRQLNVKLREQTINYAAPLRGGWMISGFPNLRSHHRFIPSNEFALDFFKPGPEGALDRGEKLNATDDYGYDEPVIATADGEVLVVIADQVQDAAALSRAEGESIEDARARITAYQMRRFAEDFRAAATGNLVVLRHEHDGVVEYSSYGHLREDSVTVKVGDRIKQGDVIGAVGNTGDSTLTHLHFQLNDGPDPFFSRSLPVKFENAAPRYIGQEPGLFMNFGE